MSLTYKIFRLQAVLCLMVMTTFSTANALSRGDVSDVDILFIGNGLTYAYDIPAMVNAIANNSGRTMRYEMLATGTETLEDHANDLNTAAVIASRKWDYVVLQEQSRIAAFRDKYFRFNVNGPAQKISKMVKASNIKGKVVFYQTFAFKDGDDENKDYMSDITTYEGMQNRVNDNYENLARKNHAKLAPVGRVWMRMRKKYPDVELYSTNTYQNEVGAYLAACTIYKTIFDDECTGQRSGLVTSQASEAKIHESVNKFVR